MRWFALLFLMAAGPTVAQTITSAELVEPTDRYDHAILGDALEWGALQVTLSDGQKRRFRLPETHVFEDVTARLADVDGDGTPEVIVVETDMARGASLAIYGPSGKIAATAPIGQTHRWLAPAGWGDFDGDGRVEIAYIDRPHLAKELVLVRLKNGALSEVLRLKGLTNHQIGDAVIHGGPQECARRLGLFLANSNWTRGKWVQVIGTKVSAFDVGPIRRPSDLDRLSCP